MASTASGEKDYKGNNLSVLEKEKTIEESSSTNTNGHSIAANTLETMTIQSFRKIASQLATSVEFLREHAADIAELRTFPYTRLPNYYHVELNGTSGNNNNEIFDLRKRLLRDVTEFPLLPQKGKLQLPMALICETEEFAHGNGALVMINYWRQLNASKQRELKTWMQRFYVRPNVTNERLNLSSSTAVGATTNASTSALGQNHQGSREHQGQSRGKSSGNNNTISWGFRCLETCTQLAQALGLCQPGENPKHACDLLRTANLEMPRTSCKAEDCDYPALARNHGYCCRHGLHFGPTPGKVHGRRGYLLLGDVYTRPYVATTTIKTRDSDTIPTSETNVNSFTAAAAAATTTTTVKKLTTCSCRNETCVGIGYSSTMIQFDIHRIPNDLRDAIWSNPEALDMNAQTHFRTSRNKTNDNKDDEASSRSSVLRLAPWHFHPQHREFLPDCSWKLIDPSPTLPATNGESSEDETPDATPKEWKGIPLPTYSPKDFLEEPIMKEYASRKMAVASTTDILPSWCREYSRIEEGPSSISEAQRNFLWKQTIDLEQKLAAVIVSSRNKERALERKLETLKDKYNEKKFLKRRDKKRKQNNSNKNKNTFTATPANTKKNAKLLTPLRAQQDENKSNSNHQNRSKKQRNETMDQNAQNPTGYLGLDERRHVVGATETTAHGNSRHDGSSSSGMEATHRRESHRMDPVHYTNHHQRQQQHRPHHRQQHQYPHSYHPHHHVHHHTPHYRHHHEPQHREGTYPPPQQQHHRAYHNLRHDDDRADPYQEQHPPPPRPHDHPQEAVQPQQQHPPAQEQQQQRQQHHQRPRHYSQQQQDWPRGYYD